MIITNLLMNMVVLTLQGAIPTNTPAFQAYAVQVMFTNAQALASKWHLEENLVATNKITEREVTPYPGGRFSAMLVFDDRYIFGTQEGGSIGFTDKAYYQGWVFSESASSKMTATSEAGNASAYEAWLKINEEDIARHRVVAQQWSRATNQLTLRTAQQLAESAMVSVGVPVKTIGFKKPAEKKQWNWADDYTREIRSNLDGIISGSGTVYSVPLTGGRMSVAYPSKHPSNYLLPYYEFRWDSLQAACHVDVFGVTSNIVHFNFLGPCLSLPTPTNYLSLLGLPDNTVFVKRRFASPPTYEGLLGVEWVILGGKTA